MNIIFLGDIIGNAGRRAIKSLLPHIVNEYSVDLVIANGENAAGGFGITESIADELFYLGIDVITSGNHIFDKKEVLPYIEENNRLLRPANYPDGVPGIGSIVLTIKDIKTAIINISGLVFMDPLLSPFKTVTQELEKLPSDVKIKIIDFHAEATSEKMCMGWYLDGQVSAVVGTHTHIPTADERILPKGTGYITDIGMTGPYDSVIGVNKDIALKKFLTQMPIRFNMAKGDIRLCGVFLKIDDESAKCLEIKRLSIPLEI